MLVYPNGLPRFVPRTPTNRITQRDPRWEVHMKGSLACLSCMVSPAGCITGLRPYLKQAGGTKERGLCVCVSVNERLDFKNPHVCLLLEMQMIEQVHIHKWEIEPSNILITL